MRVNLDNLEFFVNLMELPMTDFDVILGMDWLFAFKVQVDCFDKTIIF